MVLIVNSSVAGGVGEVNKNDNHVTATGRQNILVCVERIEDNQKLGKKDITESSLHVSLRVRTMLIRTLRLRFARNLRTLVTLLVAISISFPASDEI